MNKLKNLIKLIKDFMSLDKNSVVIYQMGKVGSSSIEKALKDRGLHVLHIHKITPSKVYFYDLGIVDSLKLFRATIMFMFVNIIFKLRPCKVITIVRDPMERNLSQMFHHLDLLIYSHNKTDSRKEESANTLFKNIFQNDINLEYAQGWMEYEFNPCIGFDYKQSDFNIVKGYGISSSKNKQVLMLKFEKLNSLESVIGDFCGVENFKLASANRGGNKWYADLYKSFKSDITLNKDTFDLMYNNDFYKKFYSEEEYSIRLASIVE